MNKAVYAIAATVQFAILAVALLWLGNAQTRVAVVVALFFGGLSQFLAQDNRPVVQGVALFLSWVGLAFAVAAVVGFVLFHG